MEHELVIEAGRTEGQYWRDLAQHGRHGPASHQRHLVFSPHGTDLCERDLK